MKEHLKLVEIRGTIFIPQIPFSWGVVNDLQQSFKDYIPSVNTSSSPMIIEGAFINPYVLAPGEWSLVAPDKKQQVLFHEQKIDFLKFLHEDPSPETIDEFTKGCKTLFKSFSKFTNSKCSRIAIAPTFEYAGDRNDIISFVHDIFKKNDFHDAVLDNCDFSQVFRIRENILDKQIFINYLSKFYNVTKVISSNGKNQLAEATMISFDINSRVDPDITFTHEAVSDFFDKSPKFCEKFLAFYFDK